MNELTVTDHGIMKAELDVQVMTAKAYPRDVERFRVEGKKMVTMSEEIAEECFYKLPQKDKNGKNGFIEGKSVRLAEICGCLWGNLHVATRFLGNDGSKITVEGVAWDLETNLKVSEQVVRSIVDSRGVPYSLANQIKTINAASAIVRRNVTFRVIPQVFPNELLKEAKHHAIGDQKDKPTKIQTIFSRFLKRGIPEEKILGYLGRQSLDELDLNDIETLIGIGIAIKDGELSIDEAFTWEESKGDKLKALNDVLNSGAS